MFGNKKKNESPVDQADLTRSDMGGYPIMKSSFAV